MLPLWHVIKLSASSIYEIHDGEKDLFSLAYDNLFIPLSGAVIHIGDETAYCKADTHTCSYAFITHKL